MEPCHLPKIPEPPLAPATIVLTAREAALQAAYEEALADFFIELRSCDLVKLGGAP